MCILRKKTSRLISKILAVGFAAQTFITPVAFAADATASVSTSVSVGSTYTGQKPEGKVCVNIVEVDEAATQKAKEDYAAACAADATKCTGEPENVEKVVKEVCETYTIEQDRNGNVISNPRKDVLKKLLALPGAREQERNDGDNRIARVFRDNDGSTTNNYYNTQVNETSGTDNKDDKGTDAKPTINCGTDETLNGAGTKCCKNDKFNSETKECTDEGTTPTEEYKCTNADEVLVYSEGTTHKCCKADANGQAIEKWDTTTQLCVPKDSETPADPEETCGTDETMAKYTDESGKEIKKCCPNDKPFNSDTKLCGEDKPATTKLTCAANENKVNTGNGEMCCRVGLVYNSNNGLCEEQTEEKDEGGSSNGLGKWGTVGALAALLMGRGGSGAAAGNSKGDLPGEGTAKPNEAFPFYYRFGSALETPDETIYISTDPKDKNKEKATMTAAMLTAGEIQFEITGLREQNTKQDKNQKSNTLSQLDGYSFQRAGTTGYERYRIEVKQPVGLFEPEEKNNVQTNGDYFVYVFIKGVKRPFMIPLKFKASVNTLGEDGKAEVTVVSEGANWVDPNADNASNLDGEIGSAEMKGNFCTITMDTAKGYFETKSYDGASETNDVDYTQKNTKTIVEIDMTNASDEAKAACNTDTLKGKHLYLDQGLVANSAQYNGTTVIAPADGATLGISDVGTGENPWLIARSEMLDAMPSGNFGYTVWGQYGVDWYCDKNSDGQDVCKYNGASLSDEDATYLARERLAETATNASGDQIGTHLYSGLYNKENNSAFFNTHKETLMEMGMQEGDTDLRNVDPQAFQDTFGDTVEVHGKEFYVGGVKVAPSSSGNSSDMTRRMTVDFGDGSQVNTSDYTAKGKIKLNYQTGQFALFKEDLNNVLTRSWDNATLSGSNKQSNGKDQVRNSQEEQKNSV